MGAPVFVQGLGLPQPTQEAWEVSGHSPLRVQREGGLTGVLAQETVWVQEAASSVGPTPRRTTTELSARPFGPHKETELWLNDGGPLPRSSWL